MGDRTGRGYQRVRLKLGSRAVVVAAIDINVEQPRDAAGAVRDAAIVTS